jgi:predicted PurR-regulated permease PerM
VRTRAGLLGSTSRLTAVTLEHPLTTMNASAALRHIRTILLLAVGLNAPATLLQLHTPLSYGWALLIDIAVLAAAAGAIAWIAVPDIASQADHGGFGLFVATPLAAVGLTTVRRLRSKRDGPP